MKEQNRLTDYRNNNFDFLRFIAASLVMISHSVPLSNNGIEIFAYLNKNQESFGGFAVGIFFIISGYLICMSFQKTNNVIKYFISRVLRIFPALVVVVLLAAFFVGPIVTDLSLHDYFTHGGTWQYLKAIGLYPMQFTLPEVYFSEGNHGTSVNGSLWTLSYEFNCYVLVGLLGVMKLLKKEVVLFLFIFFLFSIQFQGNIFPNARTEALFPYINQFNFIKLTGCFFSGMVFYLYEEYITYNLKYFLICLLMFFFCFHYGVGYNIFFLSLACISHQQLLWTNLDNN